MFFILGYSQVSLKCYSILFLVNTVAMILDLLSVATDDVSHSIHLLHGLINIHLTTNRYLQMPQFSSISMKCK